MPNAVAYAGVGHEKRPELVDHVEAGYACGEDDEDHHRPGEVLPGVRQEPVEHQGEAQPDQRLEQVGDEAETHQ
ncbi:MAG TPA: hypothetical protein VIT65_01490 [Microlunatus sp.]